MVRMALKGPQGSMMTSWKVRLTARSTTSGGASSVSLRPAMLGPEPISSLAAGEPAALSSPSRIEASESSGDDPGVEPSRSAARLRTGVAAACPAMRCGNDRPELDGGVGKEQLQDLDIDVHAKDANG